MLCKIQKKNTIIYKGLHNNFKVGPYIENGNNFYKSDFKFFRYAKIKA